MVFYQGLLERLRSLPQVESATLMQNRIGSYWSNNTGAILDGKSPHPGQSSPMRWNAVGSITFRTLGVPLLYGRDIGDADGPKSAKVAVVNGTFVKLYLNGREPLGHTVSLHAHNAIHDYWSGCRQQVHGDSRRACPDGLFPLFTGGRNRYHAR